MNKTPLACLCALALMAPSSVLFASESNDETEHLREQIEQMQRQLLEMQSRLEELQTERDEERMARERVEERVEEVAETAEQAAAADEEGIDIGGAVRFQYVFEDYNDTNKENNGTLELDTVRLNFDGSVGDVLLSAEYRFYQYMNVVHHAWAGYDFTDTLQGQVGIHQVPFGVTPFNSHSFFFSSNYYLGLEDDYDFGVKLIHDDGPLNLQGAFYWNDELGGADGYYGFDAGDSPNNLNDRYSYDIVGVRAPGEGTFANPVEGAFDASIFNLRGAYTFGFGTDFTTEVGLSAQFGDVVNGAGDSNGSQSAYAIHLNGNYGPWNLMLQATEYEYDMDNGATRMAVGAYDFFDTISSEATTYTANLAYSLPVNWGPVSNLQFYNNYSLVTDKSGGLEDTWMNVTGVSVASGGLFTYIDLITAENQPFIGGTFDSATDGGTNTRFNINFGYYF